MRQSGALFGYPLREHINLKHPLIELAERIDWPSIEAVCSSSFTSGRGRAVVDRGYRGVDIPGVRILRSGHQGAMTRGLKAMIKRRSAIEPAVGHMKADGKLGRNWLKGAIGDAMHAVLCGSGHNIRLLRRRLRLFCAQLLRMLGATVGPVDRGGVRDAWVFA